MGIRAATESELRTFTELVVETVQKDPQSIADGSCIEFAPYKALKWDEDRILVAIEFWHGKPKGAILEGHLIVSTAPATERNFKLSKTYPDYWAVLEDWHHHADGDGWWTTKVRKIDPPILIEKDTPIYVNFLQCNYTGAAVTTGDFTVRLYMLKKPT